MYATVIDGIVDLHEGVPTLERMQEVVGGYITTALQMPSKHRKGITVAAFCNDEGLLEQLPIRYVRMTDRSPIAGNLIVSASDQSGEEIKATKQELLDLLEYFQALPIPLTNYTL